MRLSIRPLALTLLLVEKTSLYSAPVPASMTPERRYTACSRSAAVACSRLHCGQHCDANNDTNFRTAPMMRVMARSNDAGL